MKFIFLKKLKRISNYIELVCKNIKTKSKDLLSNIQSLVYKLIYPAILGSMIYDLFNIKLDSLFAIYVQNIFHNDKYLFLTSIVLFYLFDYYHLYTFMEKEYTKDQKTNFFYMVLDCFVSLLLLISFKSYKYNQLFSITCVSIVPLCFLGYNIQLSIKKNKRNWQKSTMSFYLPYAIIFITVNIFIYKLNYSLMTFSYFISSMIFIYGIYVFSRKLSTDRPHCTFVAMDNEQFSATTLGDFEEIFEKNDSR